MRTVRQLIYRDVFWSVFFVAVAFLAARDGAVAAEGRELHADAGVVLRRRLERRREVVEGMTIRAKGFNFEPEFTAKILKRNYRIFEVPISFNPRDYAQGKKIKLKDAFEAVWTLLRFRIWD